MTDKEWVNKWKESVAKNTLICLINKEEPLIHISDIESHKGKRRKVIRLLLENG